MMVNFFACDFSNLLKSKKAPFWGPFFDHFFFDCPKKLSRRQVATLDYWGGHFLNYRVQLGVSTRYFKLFDSCFGIDALKLH